MHKLAKEMGKWALEKAKSCGFDNVSSQDWDDLKDCMEVVKAAICADKEYREVEEMDEYGDMEKFEKMLSMGNERMGYDQWRYKSGRFAPKGRGTRRGYTPYLHMMDDMDDDEDYMDFPGIENYRMGYSAERSGNSGNRGGNRGRQSGNSGRNDYNDSYGYSDGRMMNDGRSGSKYGKSYDRYDDARRHYHEEKDMESMKKMEESFGDILEDFGEIADDTWKDLSPEQKNKQKPKINQMIQKLQKLQQM